MHRPEILETDDNFSFFDIEPDMFFRKIAEQHIPDITKFRNNLSLIAAETIPLFLKRLTFLTERLIRSTCSLVLLHGGKAEFQDIALRPHRYGPTRILVCKCLQTKRLPVSVFIFRNRQIFQIGTEGIGLPFIILKRLIDFSLTYFRERRIRKQGPEGILIIIGQKML